MREANAISVIAYRDLMKLLRDPVRMVSTFIFPFIFIAVLGGAMQASLGRAVGFNVLIVTFTGVLAQTLFQSTATGIISLIEDRENDFSQEIFVSPVSRYAIIIGKIIGESLVALPQGLAIIIFAIVLGIPFSLPQLVALLPAALIVCFFGGAFGVLVLGNLSSQRAANQIFPFIMLPQYFTAGVFIPAVGLPFYLDILSRISPLRYAVDFMRGIFYAGQPDYDKVVLASSVTNLAILAVLFAAFLAVGTVLFVRKESNR